MRKLKTILFCCLMSVAFVVNAQTNTVETNGSIDFRQNPFPPTLLLSSVLDNGFSMEPMDKIPHFLLATVVFLPSKHIDGSEVLYEGNKIIKCEIKQGDKALVTSYLNPFAMNKVTASLKHDDLDFQMDPETGLPNGNYDFTVSIADRMIFSMPFEIIVVKDADVYANKSEVRLVDGYWSKYGFYTFNSENNLEWTYYTTEMVKKMPTNANQSKSWEDEVQLFYEGKPLSKPMKHTFSSVLTKWYPQSNTFEKTNGSFIKKDELKDGHYIVKVKLNGEMREYAFEIKAGNMLLIPEQDKAKTSDITKVFEGMNKEFWVKRSK